jgi:hypothetical protein
MGITVSHNLSATTPDDPSYEIRPSHWNSVHAATINAVGSEISGAFGNGGGVSFGLSADGKITAAAPAGVASPVYVSAGTTDGDLSTIVFADSNGLAFGLNGSTITGSYTVPTQSVQTQASGNIARTGFTTTTAAGSVIAGTHDTAGLRLGVPAFLTTAQPVGAYLTTARASNDAIGLNTALTANGVSMTANSSGLSLNFPAFITTAALSNHSHGNPSLALTNLTGTTASNSAGFSLSLSAANPGGGAGGTVTHSYYDPFPGGNPVINNPGAGSFLIHNATVPNITFDRVVLPMSRSNASNSTGSATISNWFGIYTKNGSTLSLVSSVLATFAVSFHGTVSSWSLHGGHRVMTAGFSGSLSNGVYWFGQATSMSTAGANGSAGRYCLTRAALSFSGVLGDAATNRFQTMLGWGHLATTTNAVPASIAITNIAGTDIQFVGRPYLFHLVNGTV